MKKEEITFEMAQELKLIPQFTNRYTGFSMPFESRYAYEKRCENAEIGYKLERERIERDYKYVYFNKKKLKVI